MSLKVYDGQGRWRNKTVAFRISPEEDVLLETAIALSGLTKQDYIIRRLQGKEVVVVGNPRVYKALRNQLTTVLDEQRLHLKRDIERLTWGLEKAETELWKESPDPILESVAAFIMNDNHEWCGTVTELVRHLGLDMQPNVLSLHLNVNAERLYNEHRIHYERDRNHGGRFTKLTFKNNSA